MQRMSPFTLHVRWLNPSPAFKVVFDRGLDCPACPWVCFIDSVAVAANCCIWTLLQTLFVFAVIVCCVDHAALIWQAKLCHVSKHVIDIAAIATIAVAMVCSTVQECLAGEHHVWTHSLLLDLQAVLDHVCGAVRPTRSTVLRNMLVP